LDKKDFDEKDFDKKDFEPAYDSGEENKSHLSDVLEECL
jgi:hypothetical protein